MFPKKQNKKLQTTHYSLQTSGGFTLIEILLVTFITGLVFISVYLLYSSTIKHDVESRYEIIASNLAQEGVEIIRNKRDELILAGDDIDASWDVLGADCFPSFGGVEGACLFTGMDSSDQNVGYDSGGYYNCTSPGCPATEKTPFKRVCNITASDQDISTPEMDTLTVSCKVSWKSFVNPNIIRDVEAESVLTDWGAD